jgi:excisionase family DNA binding protein
VSDDHASGEPWLDAVAVARQLAVQPITIYRWCRAGRLRCFKPGKSWRIRRTVLEAFVQRSRAPHALSHYLDQFLTAPDQVLAVAEDVALQPAYDAAFFQAGLTPEALLVKFYDRQATTRAAPHASLAQRGLEVTRLERQGRLHWCPASSLAGGVTQLQQIVAEERGDQPIWAVFDWPSVGEMEAKLAQQALLAQLIAREPRLVVSTVVVEPEPEAWPPLAEQWQLLGSLRGLIRFSRTGLLLSRMVSAQLA